MIASWLSLPPREPRVFRSRSYRRAPWHPAVAVWLLAMAIRSWRIGEPDVFVFDEVFYAGDALDLIAHGVEGGMPVHPPVGKWMIGIGVRLLGFDPVGWRFAVLVAGAVVVAMTFCLADRLASLRLVAVAATSIVLLDGIAVVTGRFALLDGLVALWVLAAVGCTLAMIEAPTDQRVQRRLRAAAGVFLGLAIATKWSSALVVVVVLVTTMFIDERLPRSSRRRAHALAVVLLAVLPAVVYVISHAGWFAQYGETSAYARECAEGRCGTAPLDRVRGFVHYQIDILDFHRSLDPTHRDVRSAATWVAQTAVVELYVERPEGGPARHVLAFGNPVIWIAGTVGMLAAAVAAFRKSDHAAGFLAATALALWLPWLIGGRPGFAFYGAPLLPILALAAARVLPRIDPRFGRLIAGVVMVAALAGAVIWWPLWTGQPVDSHYAPMVLPFNNFT